MDDSTARFLQWMNDQNARIAAQVPEESLDPVRLKLEQERREKWGQLRARAHNRKAKQVHNVFGYVDPR